MYDASRYMRFKENQAIVFALALFVVAVFLAEPSFVPASGLQIISGRVDTAYLNISEVSSTHSRTIITTTTYSNKAVLSFKLKDQDQQYTISKNIGDETEDAVYDSILTGLQKATLVSVWIRKKDTTEDEPRVFQIRGDNTILLSRGSVHQTDLKLSIFMGAMGAALLLLVYWVRKRRARALS
jgi:hypothetical protein